MQNPKLDRKNDVAVSQTKSKSIAYSDGNVEKSIENLLLQAEDLSSYTDIAQELYDNWPIRYHLSSMRGNLVRHFNFRGLDLLELGAGMGAVSRPIAEQARHLTVIEGTQQRMNCLKARLRDLDNWDGIVANYQDVTATPKYDVVCFMGVLEYAGRFINHPHPFEWAIKHAYNFLKKDGVLLIAIENKNGLKYFSGATEDHYGKHYYGICGYPEINDIKTFSKKEMLEMLQGQGFNKTKVSHVWPDYKLPRAIISDDFTKNYPDVAANIATNYKFEDYSGKKQDLFSEKLFAHSLAQSGLFDNFSNSYLFVASKSKHSAVYKKLMSDCQNKEVIFYTDYRKNNVITSFVKNKKSAILKKNISPIIVHKEFIKPTETDKKALVYNDFKDDDLRGGIEVSYLLANYAYYDKSKEFFKLVYQIAKDIFQNMADTQNSNNLLPQTFDMTSQNIKILNDKFIYFDHEYAINFKMSKTYFLFRLVVNLAKNFNKLKSKPFATLQDFYLYLNACFNVKPELKACIEREVEVQQSLSRKIKNTDFYMKFLGVDDITKEFSFKQAVALLNPSEFNKKQKPIVSQKKQKTNLKDLCNYYRCRILSNLTFGQKRKHYQAKKKKLKRKLQNA